MQKKLIALAVAGILAAPMAAQAGVEVYGQARVSVNFNDNGDTTVGNEDSAISVTSHASRFGIKGSEDLGDGLSAVYQIEREVSWEESNVTNSESCTDVVTASGTPDTTAEVCDTDTNNLKARNTFVGLKGGFGTVLLGMHDTPYKMAGGELDVFVDTAGDFNAVVQHDTRAQNVIAYVSPAMNGASFAAAYVPNHTNDNLPMTADESDADAISLMGTYKAGALGAFLAYESLGAAGGNDSSGKASDKESTKVGVSYTMDATTVGLMYQMNEDGKATNALDQDVIYLSAAHKMGDLTLKAAYGMMSEKYSGANNGADLLALGVAKAYGKNVELYALYAAVSNESAGKTGLKSLAHSGVAGTDVSALSAGINIKFSSM